MKGAQERYTNEMKDHFGYYAAWQPGVPLQLGDIGVLNGNLFTKISNLNNFTMPFQVRTDTSSNDLEYSSKGAVAITSKLSGTVSPEGSKLAQGDVGFILDFSSENAVYFKADKAMSDLIDDTITIGNKVIDLYGQGKWNKNWVIITELVNTETATIVISSTSNSSLELKATANVQAADIDIADAQFGFKAAFSKGIDTKIIAQNNLTPLFKLQGIKTRIFSSPVFQSKGLTAFDIITPESSRTTHKDSLYFGYISADVRE
ncbi:hypothetical protein [Mucilaginibacter sp.]|uniref:hypothetical protein n=1 Tax=Mucilaginibacter sp. TaxID=1882438 RepID=UPI002614E9E8|nr:hypothetical protein [Mucilaginibacter sp.]MDB5128351.1 hypothetical protein [Mucilaginibacter sp.]